MRLTTREARQKIQPMEWPDGSDQPIKKLTWDAQEVLADMYEGTLSIREAMQALMPMLLPGRSWEEIKAALDLDEMQRVVAVASGDYEKAMQAMEQFAGNGAAGAAPASSPPTPADTSLPVSPEATAVPCGAS